MRTRGSWPGVAAAAALATTLAAAGLAACGDDAGDDDGLTADAAPGPDATPLPAAVGNFPEGFAWGTAIAPYQVEGGLHESDWYQWEQRCTTACSGDHADDGPDFVDHYESDLDAAAAIGNNAIRIGIDWSRLFPTAAQFPDAPDPDAVAFYHDVISAARDRGLSVMVTLHHFVTPIWLQDMDDLEARAGWIDPAMADTFATFAGWAAGEYGADVDDWITINEPLAYVLGGWISGSTPPGRSFDIEGATTVIENMIVGHARAYDAIHAADLIDADGDGTAARVSIAHHMRAFRPKDPDDPKHVRATEMISYLNNAYFLNAVVHGDVDRNFDFDADDPEDTKGDPTLANRLDFIGVNYYSVSLVIPTGSDANFPLIGLPLLSDLDRQGFPGAITDFGWTIFPAGFREVLDEAATYGLPIIVTENGLADGADAQRPRFLLEHLYELARAIDDGIDVRGYYHWSLIDNFEWSSGFCPRFGLLRVDYDDAARPRTAGEGAAVYRRIIEANTVPPAMFAEYPTYPEAGFCVRLGL